MPSSNRAYSSDFSPKNERPDDYSNPFSSADAIADFSPDAIDSILAESTSDGSAETASEMRYEYETPLKSLFKDLPKKVPRDDVIAMKREGSPTFAESRFKAGTRKARIESTGFTLHYSSPRAPSRSVEIDRALKTAKGQSKNTVAKEYAMESAEDRWVPPKREAWMVEKDIRKEKYPNGYKPMKRLSPDAMAGIRALHAQMPDVYTVPALSKEFEISMEAIQRILKSSWRPNSEEESDRMRRWQKRGESVWSRWAELGVKPPRPWRELGIGNGKPEWLLRKQATYEQPPLPALVTTARRVEQEPLPEEEAESSLADKIL